MKCHTFIWESSTTKPNRRETAQRLNGRLARQAWWCWQKMERTRFWGCDNERPDPGLHMTPGFTETVPYY